MINNYKQHNENIKNLLIGPTDQEVLNNMIENLTLEEMLDKSTEIGFFTGIKYAIENNPNISEWVLRDCIMQIIELQITGKYDDDDELQNIYDYLDYKLDELENSKKKISKFINFIKKIKKN